MFKRALLVLVGLSSIMCHAEDSTTELSDCTKNKIGYCEFLYTCKNDISILVTQKKNSNEGTCYSDVETKQIIINNTKIVVDVVNK